MSDIQEYRLFVKTNSLLWGGIYNPLIPVASSNRSQYAAKPTKDKTPTAKNIINGYLEAFDPDYVVVPDGMTDAYEFEERQRKSYDISRWSRSINTADYQKFGCLMNLPFQHLFESYIQNRGPISQTILDISFSKHHQNFLLGVFGIQQKKFLPEIINKNYVHPVSISIDNYLDYLSPNYTFPLRMTGVGLQMDGPQIIFVMNVNSSMDLFDYWNLRAAGNFVVPMIANGSVQIRCGLLKSLIQSYSFHGFSEKWICLKSRNTDRERFLVVSSCIEKLKTSNIVSDSHADFPLYNLPVCDRDDIKTNWMRLRDGMMIHQSTGEDVDLYKLKPDFVGTDTHQWDRFAVDIEVISGSKGVDFAEVFPMKGMDVFNDGLHSLTDKAGGLFGVRVGRFCTVFTNYFDQGVYFSPPSSQDVMIHFLYHAGCQVSLSSAGKITSRMIKQLDGISWALNFQNNLVLEIIDKSSGGKHLGQNELRSMISRSKKEISASPKQFLDHLVRLNILKFGISLKCFSCGRKCFYIVEDLADSNICYHCLDEIRVPELDDRNRNWAYKCFGTFNTPGKASGSFAVLLTLLYLKRIAYKISYLLSFEVEDKPNPFEVDLCCAVRWASASHQTDHSLIFVECKTASRFQKKDVESIKKMTSRFPGSIAVFATLKTSLEVSEKRLISQFAMTQKVRKERGRPYNPVIVLTRKELQNSPDVGVSLGVRRNSVGRVLISNTGLFEEISQKLYL